jgi:hypothetical protein
MLTIYLTGWIVAFGYQLTDRDFRTYDLIVCPLLWPLTLLMQIVVVCLGIVTHRRDGRRSSPLRHHAG